MGHFKPHSMFTEEASRRSPRIPHITNHQEEE